MTTARRTSSRHRLTRAAAWKRHLTGARLPAAGVSTLLAASLAVGLSNDFGAEDQGPAPEAAITSGSHQFDSISRGAERPAIEPEAKVVGKRWITVATHVRHEPSTKAKKVTTLDVGDQVAITNHRDGGWIEIQYHQKVAWIIAGSLSKEKPGPSTAPCAHGSSVESGLAPTTVAVHRAVCALFPSISSYGGLGGGGEHATGHALDIMVSGPLGWQIARYVQAHAAVLGVTEVIYQQQIWTTDRAGEGWRPMSDRGSATANHFDHVHVTTG